MEGGLWRVDVKEGGGRMVAVAMVSGEAIICV